MQKYVKDYQRVVEENGIRKELILNYDQVWKLRQSRKKRTNHKDRQYNGLSVAESGQRQKRSRIEKAAETLASRAGHHHVAKKRRCRVKMCDSEPVRVQMVEQDSAFECSYLHRVACMYACICRFPDLHHHHVLSTVLHVPHII
jgi:hypothetical protein